MMVLLHCELLVASFTYYALARCGASHIYQCRSGSICPAAMPTKCAVVTLIGSQEALFCLRARPGTNGGSHTPTYRHCRDRSTTMPNTQPLLLEASDLSSKWGFGDGDLCDDVLDAWIHMSHWGEISDEQWNDSPASSYVSSRALLLESIRTYLLPKLTPVQRGYVVLVLGIHNPIRVEPPESDDHDFETACEILEEELKLIAPVLVSPEQVTELCASLFSPRARGWLGMFDKLTWSRALLRSYIGGKTADCVEEHPWYAARRLVDELALRYSDDEMFIASELMSDAKFMRVEHDWASLTAALTSAQKLLA